MKISAVAAIVLTFLILNTSVSGLSNRQTVDFFSLSMDRQMGCELEYTASPIIAKGCKLPRVGAPKPNGSAPKGSHNTNVRESNRGKHEKADGRRHREQAKAQEKKEQAKKRK